MDRFDNEINRNLKLFQGTIKRHTFEFCSLEVMMGITSSKNV